MICSNLANDDIIGNGQDVHKRACQVRNEEEMFARIFGLAADEARQFAEMVDQIGKLARSAKNTVPVTQQKLRGLLRVALPFFDDEEGCFMSVAENRKHGDAVLVIQRIVPPFTSRHPRTVGRQDCTKFGPRKI